MRTVLKTAPVADAITRDEIKTAGFINHDQDDSYIDALIPITTAWVENYTGRSLIDQEWYIYYNAQEFKNIMALSTFNVNSINEVVYYDTENNEVAIPATDYSLLNESLVFGSSYYPTYAGSLRTFDSIRVDVSTGYGAASTDMPSEINQGLILFALHQLKRGENMAEGTLSKVPDGLDSLLMNHKKRLSWL